MLRQFIPRSHLLRTPILSDKLTRGFAIVSKDQPDLGASQVHFYSFLLLNISSLGSPHLQIYNHRPHIRCYRRRSWWCWFESCFRLCRSWSQDCLYLQIVPYQISHCRCSRRYQRRFG